MRVWIDQDLCTGDGLCTDHCPELFALGEDGISYVVDGDGRRCNDPGGAADPAPVTDRHAASAIAAAEDCPGECIFLEQSLPGVRETAWPHWGVDLPDVELGDQPRPRPDFDAGPPSWPHTFVVRWAAAAQR